MIKKTAEISIKSDAEQAQRNIFNLRKEVAGLKDNLTDAKNKFGEFSDEAFNAEQAVNKATAELKKLTKESQGLGNLKKQLAEAKIEAQNAAAQFGELSTEFLSASAKASAIDDQIKNVNETIGLFDPGAKFAAFGGALNAVAGGFSVVTGAMGAFGAESEDVEEMLLKVNSAMALTTGLNAISDSKKDFQRLGAMITSTSVAQKAYAGATMLAGAAQKFFTGAVETTSVGFKVLRGAIISTGIGALIVGIGLLVANFDDVKKAVMNFASWLTPVGDAIMYIVNAVTDFMGVTSDATRAIDKMQANAEKSLKKNAKYLQEHGDEIDEFTKRKIEAVDRYHEALKEDASNEVALRKRMAREIGAADNDRQKEKDEKRKEEQKKIDDAAKAEASKRKAAQDKINAENKANAEARKNAAKTLADQIEDLEDKTAQDKLDTLKSREWEAIKALKGINEEELKIEKEKHEKKFKILQEALDKEAKEKDDKEKEDLQKKLDGTSKEIQSEIDKNNQKKTLNDAHNLTELESIYNQLQTELDLRQAALLKEFEQKQAADLIAYEAEYGKGEGYYALKEEQGVQLSELVTSQGSEDVSLKQQFSDAKKKIDDTEEEDQKKKVAAIGQTLATASELLGENTLAGKALAIAATTISTYQSAVSSYKGMVEAIPGPAGIAAGSVAAAASVVSGLATVKKIVSVKVPSKKGSAGAGASAGGVTAPAKPSVSFQNTAQTQVADSINSAAQNRNSQPIKAYVTSSDMETALSLDRNRIEGAKF